MYHWLNQHLRLGLDEPIVERPYRRLTEEDLSVWDDSHVPPTADSRQEIWRWWHQDAQKQLEEATPRDEVSLNGYRDVVGTAWHILLRSLPTEPHLSFTESRLIDGDGFRARLGMLNYKSVEGHQAALPVLRVEPREATGRAVLWVSRAGKSSLLNADGHLREPVRRMVNAGVTVVGVDLLYQGEFLAPGAAPPSRGRILEGEEGYAGWTYCYNLPTFAQRTHDVLAVAARLSQDGEVDLLSWDRAAPWGAAAAALKPELFAAAAIRTHDFRFGELRDIYDINFVPGALKYGDLPGLLALRAPHPLWLADSVEGGTVRNAYAAANQSQNVRLVDGQSTTVDAAIDWLLAR